MESPLFIDSYRHYLDTPFESIDYPLSKISRERKSSMKKIALILGAFAFAPILAMAQTTVSGTVQSADEKPLEMAHVHLYPIGSGIGQGEPIESVEVEASGAYTLEVPKPGYYRLAFTAVDHQMMSAPLVVGEDDEALTVNARPEQFTYNMEPEQLLVIGDFNDFDFRNAAEMTRQKDGSWVYTFETDQSEVHYQIINLATGPGGEGRSINLPGSERYAYDGGGDYRSIMKVRPGEVSIVVKPSALPENPMQGSIVIYDDEWRNQIYQMDHIYEMTMRDFRTEVAAYRVRMAKAEEAGEEVEIEGDPRIIWKDLAWMMVDFMTMEEYDPRVRQFAALNLARTLRYADSPEDFEVSDESVATMREMLPLEDPIWAIDPTLPLSVVTMGVDPKDEKAIEKVFVDLYEKSTVRETRALVLAQATMIANSMGDTELAVERWKVLKGEYGDMQMVSYYIERFDPTRVIQVGNPVPAFEVTLEDGNGTVVTNETMKGQYYLIDFWATWCGPCVGEMPELHQAYKKFAGPNFEVLSLSFDSSFDKVTVFQEKRYPMPWLHTFVEGGFKNDLSQRFEVRGIPKPILVNPEGIIVAIEGDLRGERLARTLARFLGDEQASNQ